MPTTPLTPKSSTHESCANTPPAHKRGPVPDFLKALRQDSVDRVHEVLHANPDAIWCPPLDYSVDPPLCVAIELGCSPAVIKLLLDRGADVTAENMQGHTPLSLLKAGTQKLSLDPQYVRDVTMMLEMAMPSTYASNATGEQVPAFKYEGENNENHDPNVSLPTYFRASSNAKENYPFFTEMPPQFPPVPDLDLQKLDLNDELDEILLGEWCSQDDSSDVAEILPQVKPASDLSKMDLHGNLDGFLFATWYAKDDYSCFAEIPEILSTCA